MSAPGTAADTERHPAPAEGSRQAAHAAASEEPTAGAAGEVTGASSSTSSPSQRSTSKPSCNDGAVAGGEDAAFDDDAASGGLCELRSDVLVNTMSFLDVATLATMGAMNRLLCGISSSHEHWRWFVLQFFGVYYDDYMRSVDVSDEFRWRRLFIYIRQVHRNVDRKRGFQQTLPQLLRPCARLAGGLSGLEEDPDLPDSRKVPHATPRRARRRYRGSLELADNCNVFFWENGRIVQVVRAHDGQVIREIDTGQVFRRYFHRLANVKNRLFVCLNDCIKVWEYGAGDEHKPPTTLPPPRRPPSLKVGRPLELLVHRRRLILLESNCCLLWDTDTFEFVCCIQHDDVGVERQRASGAALSPVAGSSAAASADAEAGAADSGPETSAVSRDPSVEDSDGNTPVIAVSAVGGVPALGSSSAGWDPSVANDNPDEARALEVQWMGDLIITWVRTASRSLNVWTLTGQQRAHLRTDNPLVQVDVARVTWVSVQTLDHFILSALDSRSVVSLWDSKQNFCPIFRFYCGCEEPFDLVLTQDFMAVVNDNMAESRLELCFWKLWLHPNFDTEAASPAERAEQAQEAARQRQATVQPGGSPLGARFSIAGGGAGGDSTGAGGGAGAGGAGGALGVAAATAAHLGGETLAWFLRRELRPNARPIKKFSIPDIDSCFASYRNFLNVCSFHKSGQESLSVYRSSSLQKKIFFPPAKHTKFEEWLALQVHSDGTVVLHDFRPNQVAFDEIVLDWPRAPHVSKGAGAAASARDDAGQDNCEELARPSEQVPAGRLRGGTPGSWRRARRA